MGKRVLERYLISGTILPPDKRREKSGKSYLLPVRLMVGLRFLVPSIGVRVPDGQQMKK